MNPTIESAPFDGLIRVNKQAYVAAFELEHVCDERTGTEELYAAVCAPIVAGVAAGHRNGTLHPRDV